MPSSRAHTYPRGNFGPNQGHAHTMLHANAECSAKIELTLKTLSKNLQRRRRASRSHSRRVMISSSRTGPLMLRMIVRLESSRNSMRTCVTLPVLPVRPRTLITFPSLISPASACSYERDSCACMLERDTRVNSSTQKQWEAK